jgi:transcriptional regulator with XRE-family HTH domain
MTRDIRARGMTQQEIAVEVGCAQSTVNAWEHGKRGGRRGVSGDYLLKLMSLHQRVLAEPVRESQ